MPTSGRRTRTTSRGIRAAALTARRAAVNSYASVLESISDERITGGGVAFHRLNSSRLSTCSRWLLLLAGVRRARIIELGGRVARSQCSKRRGPGGLCVCEAAAARSCFDAAIARLGRRIGSIAFTRGGGRGHVLRCRRDPGRPAGPPSACELITAAPAT